MIREAYCSYEVAKLLKEKGFAEDSYNGPFVGRPTLTRYWTKTKTLRTIDEDGFSQTCEYKGGELFTPMNTLWYSVEADKNSICAPTHQMAMAWLRTKHRIIVVYPEYFNVDGICSYWGVDIWESDNYVKLQGDYPSYEEAVEEALKYCLKNLI